MKPSSDTRVYDIISSQEMVTYMWKYCMHLQATQVPCAIAFDEYLDFNILARAVNVEIERNDCLRLRVFKSHGKIKQYFLGEYKLDKILVKEFRTKDEQEKYFDSIGETALKIWDGEMFKIVFFRSYNGKSGIFVCTTHFVMDGAATFIFFRDLMDVYDSLKNNTPLPKPLAKYEDVVKKELSDPDFKDRIARKNKVLDDWVVMDRKPTFCSLNGPKLLDLEKKLTFRKNLTIPAVYYPFYDKTHFIKMSLNQTDSNLISEFIDSNGFSPEWVIQLGYRIYLSKVNRHVNDTLFWVLSPRRNTVKEKRCGGTLACPLPWREILPENMTFREAVNQLAQTQAFLFRYSEVPFIPIRESELKLFNISLLKSANSMMFSYFPLNEKTFGGRTYEYLGYSMGHYCMPLYTIALKDADSGCYKFSYIHRLLISSDEEVCDFHNGVVKALIAGVSSPDKTIGEIMEEI